jgi:hypothetical protein
MTARQTLTPQQRARLFVARGGRCHRCRRELRPGDKWIVEHVIALQNGGTNDWSNLDLTCGWCVPWKNAEDAALAAKGRRITVKHVVPREACRYGRARPANTEDHSRTQNPCSRCRQVHLRPGYCQALDRADVTDERRDHVTDPRVTDVGDHKCDICGRPFAPRRAGARYCSAACRQRASRHARAATPRQSGPSHRAPDTA